MSVGDYGTQPPATKPQVARLNLMTQDSPSHHEESAAKNVESHDANFEASRSDSAEPLADNDDIPPLIHQTSPERPVGVT